MAGFSLIDAEMNRFAQEVEERKALQPAEPWPENQRGKAKRDERIKKSSKDFWAFDALYFPADMYSEGHYPENDMMKDIVKHTRLPGVHVELGPRLHGKTTTAKKALVWLLVTNQIQIAGTYSHTLPTSENILSDIAELLKDNPRLVEDYGIEFAECNAEQFKFRTRVHRKYRYCAAFSEGRSVRGFSRIFGRPQFILGDDIETLMSPLGDAHTRERIDKVGEAFLSLTATGTFMWLGNNFDEGCATNTLLQEQESGTLNEHWHVHLYDAWNEEKGEPMWKARYGAISEEELQAACRARNAADWSGNFRSRPMAPDGDRYPRRYYTEYKHLPTDAKGVIYCDPNLSKKGRGDQTALIAFLYSPKLDEFYIARLILKSYSSSNKLLRDVLKMKARFPLGTIFRIGFDGNVNQESNWTNNVRNFCLLYNQPFPHIEYLHLNVDLFSKNAEVYWEQRKILMPEGSAKHPIWKRALNSLCTFVSKKQKRRDDFPDAVINAHELICSTGFVRPKKSQLTNIAESVTDHYKF